MIIIKAHSKHRIEFKAKLLETFPKEIESILPGDSCIYLILTPKSTFDAIDFLRFYIDFINTKV